MSVNRIFFIITILRYLEAKFYNSYFIFLLHYGSTILHKKIQVISSKNQGMTAIFPIQIQIKIWENCRHAFIFAQNDLKFFFVGSCNHTRTLNGTRKVHHLEVVGPSKVEYYPFKGSSIKKVHNFK